jgi:hypothetical protein
MEFLDEMDKVKKRNRKGENLSEYSDQEFSAEDESIL